MAKVCFKSGRAVVSKWRGVCAIKTGERDEESGGTESSAENSDIHAIKVRTIKGYAARLSVLIQGHKIKMLYDPGAARSIINQDTWNKIGAPYLTPTVPLMAYTNVPVQTLGEARVLVEAFGRKQKVPVIVIKEHDKPLFGLDYGIQHHNATWGSHSYC